MGAHDISATLPGDKTRGEVLEAFKRWQEDDRAESGGGAYAGNWTTVRDIKFHSRVCEDETEAHDYCLDKSEKWSYAVAVKFKAPPKPTKVPTFNGKEAQIVIGQSRKCYAFEYGRGTKTVVPADQLTDAQKARCSKLVIAASAAEGEYSKARREFQSTVQKYTEDLEWWDAKALKSVRATMYKARAKRDKTAATLSEFNAKMVAKLYKEKTSGDLLWKVAGWAAS